MFYKKGEQVLFNVSKLCSYSVDDTYLSNSC